MSHPVQQSMTEEQQAAVATLREVFDSHELEWKEISPGMFTVVLPGEKKLQTPCRFDVGEHALGVHAFVARRPDENHERVYRWLLERNLKLYGVSFALDHMGDIYLDGRLPLSAVTADEVDRLLGAVLSYADESFNTILELGFAMCLIASSTDVATRGFILLTLMECTPLAFAVAMQNVFWLLGHANEIRLLTSALGREGAVALFVLPFAVSVAGGSPRSRRARIAAQSASVLVLAAFAGFTLAAALAALYLVEERRLQRRAADILRLRLPSLVVLERVMGKTILVSLPLLTLGLVIGGVRLWQDGGGIDTLIAATILAWLVYGAFLVLRPVGRTAAHLVLLGFALVVLVRIVLAGTHS